MFLTIHHPIIRSIVKYLSEGDTGLKPTAALRIESPVADPGDYLYFIYMLEEFSLKKALKLVPLLVKLDDHNVVHVADALSGPIHRTDARCGGSGNHPQKVSTAMRM